LAGIALACQNRVENAQTAHPGNVADDVMKVQVHLLQGLLHVLNFGPGRRDQIEPMALQASQRQMVLCTVMNPARKIKIERFSRTEGKTSAFGPAGS
jgi:hypothetical protein